MKVLIAGGGTAGHINPGIDIAKYFKCKMPDAQIVFVGTKKGLESKLVPREGFELKLITVRGFRRKISFDTLVAFKEMIQGIIEARRIIKQFKPDIVIGTGGYVCGPVLYSAARMKIPTLIHEQNAIPGVTNKILSRYVDSVAISFKESGEYFKNKKKLIHTGNPVKSEMLEIDRCTAREKLKLEQDKPVVLIFGGSRGAEKINSTVVEMIKNHHCIEDCVIIFATGELQYNQITENIGEVDESIVRITPYIYDMENAMAAADLVVCRAGAITISELTALGTPSILIPSPYVTANHQEFNARALEEQGASVVILEKNLNGELLYSQVLNLLKDRDQLMKMAKNSKKLGIVNATEKIYSIITELSKN